MAKQAAEVHELTRKHNNIHFTRWRGLQVPLQNENSQHVGQALQAMDNFEGEIILQQRQAAQPRPRRYELSPSK